jgi:hypothetical protein
MLKPPPKHALNTEILENAIDKVCANANLGKHKHHSLQRLEENDVSTILEMIESTKVVTLDESLCNGFSSPPLYYGIVLRGSIEHTTIVGFAIFHLSFSTWDGRVLYLNYLHLPVDSIQKEILQILAKIAMTIECSRLTWHHDSSMLPMCKEMGAETPDEIWTLCLDRTTIDTFVATGAHVTSNVVWKGALTAKAVHNAIDMVLPKANDSLQDAQLCLRRARKEDIELMQRLIYRNSQSLCKSRNASKCRVRSSVLTVLSPRHQCTIASCWKIPQRLSVVSRLSILDMI